MVLWHFHRLFVYYFLNFDNCDFKVKSCFVLFLQIKNVNYNSNKFIWGKQTSINKHLFRDCVTLCTWEMVSQVSIKMASLVTAVFHFFSLWQIPAISISTTPKPFCFHWWTSQDGHLLNCLKQENIVLEENIPYVFVHRMDPHSVEEKKFTFPTTRHPIAIHTATLAILIAHRAGTATAASSPKHSWQELTTSLQTK